jgi:Tol biopolymer transport system component
MPRPGLIGHLDQRNERLLTGPGFWPVNGHYAGTKPAHRDASENARILAGHSPQELGHCRWTTTPNDSLSGTEAKMSLPRSTITCLRVPSRLRAMLPLLVAVSAAVAVRPTAVADDTKPQRTLGGHRFEVHSVAFSPDGKTLASGGGYFSADLKPGEIMLWDVGTGQLRDSFKGHAGGVWSVAFSPDGKTLASGSADKTVRLWDVTTGRTVATLAGHTDWVRSVAFTPDSKTVASASNDQTIKVWDVATGRERRTLNGHTGGVASLAIAPDGKTLASNGFDNTVRIWDLSSGKELKRLPGPNLGYAMSFSPDGSLVSIGGFQGVDLWDLATGQVRAKLRSESPNVYATAFSPDGNTLAAAGADKVVRVWDVAGQREKFVLPHGNVVLCVAFSPDGKLLASGNGATEPFEVKLWDVAGALGNGRVKD